MSSRKISKVHQRVMDSNRVSLKDSKAEESPNNNFWDDAKEHYVKSINAIAQVEGTLRDTLVGFVGDKEKLSHIKDEKALADNIVILTKDIEEHAKKLNDIYSKHSDRSGGTVTPDEHMELLHIHGEYADALEVYQANIIPTVAFILEQVGAAEELIIASNAAGATDVNVITDVEIKETVTVQ